MATTASHNGRQQHMPSASHGPVPGSPTLTNPDMILPDYEMPDSPEALPQSVITSWRDPNLDQLDFQLQSQNNFGSIPTTTPIIYGNGTMLSDIGEVTEVESNAGTGPRRASSRYSAYTDAETFGGSPTLLNKGFQRRSTMDRERRSSVDSTSTVTTQRNAFGDFDDSMSVGDSCFQGDDEESMASEFVEGTNPNQTRIRPQHKREGDAKYATTDIGQRAEQILANAKRRLTAMEGNLSRARSSLGYSDGSTPSPQLGRSASAIRDGAAATSLSHSRIKSEDGIGDLKQMPALAQRSASAMGAAGGYRQPSLRTKQAETELPPSRLAYGISQHPLDTTLEPLSEDDDEQQSTGPTNSARNSMRDSHLIPFLLSPTFGADPDRGLTRSASVAQMRDIQDQMQGLRGKISTLKQQARADSLKRRSLQSLRTPSPFTHARWDGGYVGTRSLRSSSSSREGTPTGLRTTETQSPIQEMEGPERDEPAVGDVQPGDEMEPSPEEATVPQHQPASVSPAAAPSQNDDESRPHDFTNDSNDDMRTENGDSDGSNEEEEAFDDARAEASDWGSESGESTYHDTFQHQVSHEDREDAFDYEHFFLHSALGSISRQHRESDSESDVSDDSVETTRGPIPTPSSMSFRSAMSRKRQSVDTTASDDTFATATEGRASRSSTFKTELGLGIDSYDELPPLEEERSNAGDDAQMNEMPKNRQRQNSVLYRPTSAAQADRLHRPSISSFESTGTNRSFPLVNKAKLNGGVLTPGGSPDPMFTKMSEALMNDTTRALGNGDSATALRSLHKDDQFMVERLVASIGKCALGLSEASMASTEARVLRRRMDAARRILEGLDDP
ncbi:uncharacterized protein F5Z01DRAFT_309781 [Emericellopsis atlantica]|uniref:Uncharacterized protein n=1 Tax=Emericellopsis atlantica TaxID=2614577 RepID=A0A9P7ZT85_9HYPO|nr:uncharacterized protein F5Z01DRAFT_309781 [Emericellopsis atlantica]KAG9257929.1 hypothetical protein F5Z01DRAFT_309781 [Emericellopsis atlantica]